MNAKPSLPPPAVNSNWRSPVLGSYLLILIAFGAGGGWSTVAKLESAAIASGIVMSQSNKKTIQHLEGGIVREILVRDGDRVTEGQVLIRLDRTQAQANLETLRMQQAIAQIQEARLIAERTQTTNLILPEVITRQAKDLAIARAIEDQRNNIRERASYLHSQIDVQNAKIRQTEQDISALQNDTKSTREQLVTINQELDGLRQLLAKQLVPLSRVAALERERIKLQGALDRSISDAEKGQRVISETKLTIIQIQNQFYQQVASEIIDVRKNLAELGEKERVAQDILKRLDITAPRSGIVQGLKVFTVGAVIRPGDPLMDISPTGDQLIISMQISPNDIDSVSEGLKAEVRFPAYHSRRVPTMLGTVRSISYDRVIDPQNQQNSYFQGEVAIQSASIPLEIKDKLKPGMPADVIVTTGEQTPFDYFIAPLLDRVGHGLREK